MHLGKPLQRRVIAPRPETLPDPATGDERPPFAVAEPGESPVTVAEPPEAAGTIP